VGFDSDLYHLASRSTHGTEPTLDLVTHPDATAAQAVMDALCAGFRLRDAGRLAALYREDVEFVVVNRNNPPSKRLVIHGREGVRRLFEDMCSREMTHDVSRMIVSPGSIAFATTCNYPDGCCVMGISLATVVDGLISREFSVDCWDE
jgi:ketosteroid isomerase-like protein